jgi:hypothetical protein
MLRDAPKLLLPRKKVEVRSDWLAPPRLSREGADGGACHSRHMCCLFDAQDSTSVMEWGRYRIKAPVSVPGTSFAWHRPLHMRADLIAKPDLVDRHDPRIIRMITRQFPA